MMTNVVTLAKDNCKRQHLIHLPVSAFIYLLQYLIHLLYTPIYLLLLLSISFSIIFTLRDPLDLQYFKVRYLLGVRATVQ